MSVVGHPADTGVPPGPGDPEAGACPLTSLCLSALTLSGRDSRPSHTRAVSLRALALTRSRSVARQAGGVFLRVPGLSRSRSGPGPANPTGLRIRTRVSGVASLQGCLRLEEVPEPADHCELGRQNCPRRGFGDDPVRIARSPLEEDVEETVRQRDRR